MSIISIVLYYVYFDDTSNWVRQQESITKLLFLFCNRNIYTLFWDFVESIWKIRNIQGFCCDSNFLKIPTASLPVQIKSQGFGSLVPPSSFEWTDIFYGDSQWASSFATALRGSYRVSFHMSKKIGWHTGILPQVNYTRALIDFLTWLPVRTFRKLRWKRFLRFDIFPGINILFSTMWYNVYTFQLCVWMFWDTVMSCQMEDILIRFMPLTPQMNDLERYYHGIVQHLLRAAWNS